MFCHLLSTSFWSLFLFLPLPTADRQEPWQVGFRWRPGLASDAEEGIDEEYGERGAQSSSCRLSAVSIDAETEFTVCNNAAQLLTRAACPCRMMSVLWGRNGARCFIRGGSLTMCAAAAAAAQPSSPLRLSNLPLSCTDSVMSDSLRPFEYIAITRPLAAPSGVRD